MPKLPRTSAQNIIKALQKLGFQVARQNGSHIVLTKMTDLGKIGCVVPNHKEVAVGTLSSILKQAKISAEEFIQLL